MQPHTKRQREVLDYITRFAARHGYGPSYQQIARHLGVRSKSGIARHIRSLESQGLLSRKRVSGSFTIALHKEIADEAATSRVPILPGSIAGNSVSDEKLKHIYLHKFLLGDIDPEDALAFIVPNDSMTEKLIKSEDIAILERKSFAREGDIVVFLSDRGDHIIGQYFPSGAKTEIRPANPAFESLFVSSDSISIQGVVRGIIRLPLRHGVYSED